MEGSTNANKRLTAAEKVRREATLVADRLRGLSWGKLSERYGLTARQCQSIWNERERIDPPDEDPFAAIGEHIESLEVSIGDYDELARRADNDSARLGAINRRVELQQRLFELRRDYGLIPQAGEAPATTRILPVLVELLSRADLSGEDRAQVAAVLPPPGPRFPDWLTRATERHLAALSHPSPSPSPEPPPDSDEPQALLKAS